MGRSGSEPTISNGIPSQPSFSAQKRAVSTVLPGGFELSIRTYSRRSRVASRERSSSMSNSGTSTRGARLLSERRHAESQGGHESGAAVEGEAPARVPGERHRAGGRRRAVVGGREWSWPREPSVEITAAMISHPRRGRNRTT